MRVATYKIFIQVANKWTRVQVNELLSKNRAHSAYIARVRPVRIVDSGEGDFFFFAF
jgi:hypothetical protein